MREKRVERRGKKVNRLWSYLVKKSTDFKSDCVKISAESGLHGVMAILDNSTVSVINHEKPPVPEKEVVPHFAISLLNES